MLISHISNPLTHNYKRKAWVSCHALKVLPHTSIQDNTTRAIRRH